MGESPYADRFVLKGAMLFKLWSDERRRATWDLDLLGRGANTVTDVVAALREICQVGGYDGIKFNPESITGEEIRAADEYAGVRVRLEARLAEARIPVQVDVGFGDSVVPAPIREDYPVLLDQAPPRVLAYPRETVVAEKFEVMVSLGVTNSRMKDFYDVYVLATLFAFDGLRLQAAIQATFARRQTPFPLGAPVSLKPEFVSAPEQQIQWRAFLRRGRLTAPPEAAEVYQVLRGVLLPVMEATRREVPFEATWKPGGAWRSVS
jgi:hypothetical protein